MKARAFVPIKGEEGSYSFSFAISEGGRSVGMVDEKRRGGVEEKVIVDGVEGGARLKTMMKEDAMRVAADPMRRVKMGNLKS